MYCCTEAVQSYPLIKTTMRVIVRFDWIYFHALLFGFTVISKVINMIIIMFLKHLTMRQYRLL